MFFVIFKMATKFCKPTTCVSFHNVLTSNHLSKNVTNVLILKNAKFRIMETLKNYVKNKNEKGRERETNKQ